MRFMILVKATKDSEKGAMPPEKLMSEMQVYHERLQKAGLLVDGAGLQRSAKGWRIKWDRGGRKSFVDGPFAETKELVAGYTIIEVRDREQALEWAGQFPNPSIDGGEAEIEVRQFFELEDFGDSPVIDKFKEMNMQQKGK